MRGHWVYSSAFAVQDATLLPIGRIAVDESYQDVGCPARMAFRSRGLKPWQRRYNSTHTENRVVPLGGLLLVCFGPVVAR